MKSLVPKITPPQLDRVLLRPRLSAVLTDATAQSAVWLHAPGGFGKTTAVAMAAAKLRQPLAWLHVDAGDSDPAGGLPWLVQALSAALKLAPGALPVFVGETELESALFTRRLARKVLETSAGKPGTLVLDNLQDLRADAPVAELIAALCEELAPAWSIFLISREPPGRAMSKLLGQGRLRLVPPATVTFTETELKEALWQRGVIDEAELARLWRQSRGWIAGALLLSLQGDMGSDDGNFPADAASGSNFLFDYFATQAFARLDAEDRALLTRTALLDSVTTDSAVRLSGMDDAGRRLDALCQASLFTMRLGGSPARYRYHDLFRDFLRAEAARSLSADALRQLQAATAEELVTMREPLAALELLIAAAEWERFREVTVTQAETLLNQGHFQSLAAMMRRLPVDVVEKDAWLRYWSGQCQLGIDDDRALADLSAAYSLFEARGDAAGQLLAAIDLPATILNQLKDQSAYDLWLDRVESHMDAATELSSRYLSLKVLGGLLGAALISKKIEAQSDALVRQLLDLVPQVEDPNVRLQALTHVASLAWRFRRRDLAPPIIAMVEDQQLESLASPLLVLHWYYDIVTFDSMYGDPARALAYSERAEAIATETGLDHADFEALLLRLEVICDRNDIALAEALLVRLARHANPARPFSKAAVHAFSARIALLKGEGEVAHRECQAALAVLDSLNFPPGLRSAYFMIEVGALTLLGRHDEALAACARYRPHFKFHNQQAVDIFAAWIAAAKAEAMDDGAARESLRAAIGIAQAEDYHLALRHANSVAAALCARALAWEIEPAFISAIIARRRLPPPDRDLPEWPWPVRIFALGRFDIEVKGKPISQARGQVKVIQLLQALIALGGASVPADDLMALLWPGEGRQGTQQVLDTTLHRLRKLLDDDSAIQVSDRCLTLNRQRVWVDALALASCLDRPTLSRETLGQWVARYHGHFLAHLADAAWAEEMRARLWRKLHRALSDQSAGLIASGDRQSAADILHYIAEHDPLAEESHLALISHYADAGQVAEALRAYERCARTLASELGVRPSAALQALAAQVRAMREG